MLSGLVTFGQCTFEGHTLILDANKGQGQHEPDFTEETLRLFHSSNTEEFTITGREWLIRWEGFAPN